MILISKNKSEINFTILENGLDFILSSVKYLSDGDDKHNLKYSILHLSSGIELIFKYRLLIEDWKYLFQNISKADEELFLKGDFQSVNSKTCEERLKEYCNIDFNDDDTEILKILREKRNNLEHFSITDSIQALRSYYIKILNLLVNFINNNFDSKKFSDDEDELLQEIRMSLADLQDFVVHRWTEIESEIENYSKYNTPIKCPRCLQEALITDDGSECLFCGYTDESEKVADEYIWKVMRISKYETIKHGGEYPQYNCPECGAESFIHDEDNEIWKCLNCGEEYSEEEIDFCTGCGTPYVLSEIEDLGLCDNCLDYKLNNED